MNDLIGFKNWLECNTDYSRRTVSNIVSRFKRADSMLPWYADDVYLFRLEQLEQYQNLSVAVKSQIKKAVKLYFKFTNEDAISNGKEQ